MLKNKTVLFIHGSADLYGASKVFRSVIKNSIKTGIKPVVLLPYKEKLDLCLENDGAVVIIGPVAVLRRQLCNPAGIFILLLDMIKSLSLIRKIDKEYSLDAIYSNTSPVLSGAVYAKFAGTKHIWHIHEIITKPRVFKFIMPRCINFFSDICIAVSCAVKQYLISGGVNKSKVIVIYNGVAAATETKYDKVQPSFKNKITIGIIGRINWMKGQEIFIKAASRIINMGYDVNFMIVGGYFKNEKKYLVRIRELISTLDLEKNIRILSFIDDLNDIYKSVDIVVAPSLYPEGFGLVITEAMAHGKPVVASNIEAFSEIVINKKTGFLFTPGRVDELTDAIMQLLNNEKMRTEMGEAGLARQQEYFSEDRFEKKVRDFFIANI